LHRGKRTDLSLALGARVLGFARARQGTQVGDGECTTLVQQALLGAGARTTDVFGAVTPDGDYVWGTPVALANAKPGDILQFRNYRVVRHVLTQQRMADGEVSPMQSEDFEVREHHTAIVEQNFAGTLSVLEQNVDPGGRVVQRGRVETASRTYTQTDPETGNQVTTTVEVDGEVMAYRPQKASPAELAASAAAEAGQGYATESR
jgi:hypothetical protein